MYDISGVEYRTSSIVYNCRVGRK